MTQRTPTPRDEASLLAAARKHPSPVYLLVGEPFQTEAVARQLIDILVPPEHRAFNLETYDGRTSAIGPILDSLRMRGLFSGAKVIWVREPTLFLSTEKRGDITAALFEAWEDERRADAAERFLTLAAMAGWTQERLSETDWETLPETALRDLLGQSADRETRHTLAQISAYCRDRGLVVTDYRDESALLADFVERGLPPDTVLVFTVSSAAVDRRKRLVKLIARAGATLDLTLERQRSGALSPASVDRIIDQTLLQSGKRLHPAARRLIHQRAGTDAAALAMELEKLVLYAGEAKEISEEEVRQSVRDLAESWVFDFTRALSRREAGTAVRLLRGLFAQGEHPLRLLALIARELRLLLLARDCIQGPLAGKWNTRTSFAAFRDRLWPEMAPEYREAFAGVHPYGIYLALQNAARARTARLRRAVLDLQRLDNKLKSSAGDPRILLEDFVLDLCREGFSEGPG